VYGAGAIGGFIGLRLAMAGHEVSVVARGATLEAIQKYGLRARTSEGLLNADVAASEDPGALGPQDLVIIAVKTPSLAQIAGKIDPLLGQETVIVTAMNGIPWWFFHGFGGSCEDKSLDTVDPDGVIAAGISSARVIGGVVHGSWKVEEPGLVQHVAGNRLIVGEPAGGKTQRAKMVADTLTNAGYDVEISSCIQREIWYKLLGNMTMNPISALTGATCDRILDDPLVGRFTLDIMAEAGRIGAQIGCPIEQSGEERNALTRRLGAFKTSMLQDVEAGKPVEIDALVAAVREIGQMTGEPTPSIDTLLGLSRLHARVRGLYPEEHPEVCSEAARE